MQCLGQRCRHAVQPQHLPPPKVIPAINLLILTGFYTILYDKRDFILEKLIGFPLVVSGEAPMRLSSFRTVWKFRTVPPSVIPPQWVAYILCRLPSLYGLMYKCRFCSHTELTKNTDSSSIRRDSLLLASTIKASRLHLRLKPASHFPQNLWYYGLQDSQHHFFWQNNTVHHLQNLSILHHKNCIYLIHQQNISPNIPLGSLSFYGNPPIPYHNAQHI